MKGVLAGVIASAVLAGCAARPEIPRDRFGLASQSDVSVIHGTAKAPFAIKHRNDLGAGAGPAYVAQQVTRNFQSARLQQKLDLEDPAPYLKDRLVQTLRERLNLPALRVIAEPSDVPVTAFDAPVRIDDPSSQRVASDAMVLTKEFKQKYPAGAVIEVITQHWGIDDYRAKYYASVRLIDVRESKVLLSTYCRWVVVDSINPQKLYSEATAFAGGKITYEHQQAYTEKAEGILFADNGALLKKDLRRAAETCADRIAPRFLGPRGRGKPGGEPE